MLIVKADSQLTTQLRPSLTTDSLGNMPPFLPLILAATASPGCDLQNVVTARAAHDVLSSRAIEAVALATDDSPRSIARLTEMIDPAAVFVLGSGDVGRPLDNGVAGLKELAKVMNPAEFRSFGWDYMDGPASACSGLSVLVEFTDQPKKYVSKVEFTFRNGRITGAQGWQRSFKSGAL